MRLGSRIALTISAILFAAAADAAPTLTAIVSASASTTDSMGTNITGPEIYHYTIDAVPANGQSQIQYLVEQTAATYPTSGEQLAVFGSVGATAGLGHLHAYANSEGHRAVGAPWYLYGTAGGYSRTNFTDTITIQPSPSHPLWTWVTVNAKLAIDKTISYGPGAEVIITAGLHAQGPQSYTARDDSGNPFGGNNTAFHAFHALNNVVDNNQSNEEMVGEFMVGVTYTIYGSLEAKVITQVGNTYYGSIQDSWGNADVMNTSHSYIWPDDPTLVVTTGSGASYAPPVPEPTSLAVLVLGACGLLGRRRVSA